MFPVKKKTNFQAELNAWTIGEVILPMAKPHATNDSYVIEQTSDRVTKAIAQKTRESFLNGLKAQRK
ncbi:MAG: hypothetical protein OEQ39_27000 [Gammaproteobacteria bacterium]|nr:hypothetical protein [Gammaproteobacteria bacterium]